MSYIFENSLIETKKAAIVLAFSCPMCLIPIEYINLSKITFFDLSIAFFKLLTDKSPQPSRFLIFLQSNLKISAGSFIRFKENGETDKRVFRFKNQATKYSAKNPLLYDGDIINIRLNALGKATSIIKEVGAPVMSAYGLYKIFD